MRESLEKYLNPGELTPERWDLFVSLVTYVRVDATVESDFVALKEALQGRDDHVRVIFLSMAPSLFTAVCANLAAAKLVTPKSRVVLEKPLGQDRVSAEKINSLVGSIFEEKQIYRIDHYLGKEAVQNLIALRFGNALFEPLWRRGRISNVQITVAEQVGAEGRGEFYDQTGALRDMVQNHLLQLLCILAMEPPASSQPDAVRDEKLKVLRALRPIVDGDVQTKTVRGQYRAGAIAGKPVIGYLDEPGVPADSRTETFVALKAQIETWRWAGVPFYLRTGKRLQEQMAEIVVTFERVPHFIFEERPATGAESVDHPAAAGRRHHAQHPLESAGRDHAAQAGEPRPALRRHLQGKGAGCVRAPDHRCRERQSHAVHAQRRAGCGVGVDRPHPRRLGADR